MSAGTAHRPGHPHPGQAARSSRSGLRIASGITRPPSSSITEAAGVGLGTFYLYFDGKQSIFDEVVEDLNIGECGTP